MISMLRRRLASALSSSLAQRRSTWFPRLSLVSFEGLTPTVLLPAESVSQAESEHIYSGRLISYVFIQQLCTLRPRCDSWCVVVQGGVSRPFDPLNFRRQLTAEANVERHGAKVQGHEETDSSLHDDQSQSVNEAILEGVQYRNSHVKGLESEVKNEANVKPEEDRDENTKSSSEVAEICAILNEKPWGSDTVVDLENMGVSWNPHSIRAILKATKSIETAYALFKWLKDKGVVHDSRIYETMIYSFGRARCFIRAKEVADEMCKAGLTLGEELLSALIKYSALEGDASGATGYWEALKRLGHQPSEDTYTIMFDVLAKERRYKEAVDLYLRFVEEGLSPSSRTLEVLILHLLEAGKLEASYFVFSKMLGIKLSPRLSTYAFLMAAYAKVGNLEMVKKLGRELKLRCDKPGNSFRLAMVSLVREGKVDEANFLAAEVWPDLSMEERRAILIENEEFLQPDELYDEGISYSEEYFSDGDLLSVEAGDERPEDGNSTVPESRRIKSLLKLAKNLKTWDFEAASVLEQMHMEWNSDVVYGMLKQFKEVDTALGFFSWLKRLPGFNHDIHNRIFMLRRLAQSGNFSAVVELLREAQAERARFSVNTFNMIIRDFGLAKNSGAALRIFDHMKALGLEHDEETMAAMLYAFARDNKPDQAFKIWEKMNEAGFKQGLDTYRVLIHSLGLAGKLEEAGSVFKQMSGDCIPDTYTCTSIIYGASLAGHTDLALQFFEYMKGAGIAPTQVTLGIMSRVFDQVGNAAEAKKLELQMQYLYPKHREEALMSIYNTLLENLVEEERSESLLVSSNLR